MKVVYGACGHGHEPYLLAGAIGREVGNVVVPLFPMYGKKQEDVMRNWYGDDRNILLDPVAGEISQKLAFNGDYRDFVRRNLNDGPSVKIELDGHLSDFSATSLYGEKRDFKKPSVVISTGARFLPESNKKYYAFPALNSDVAGKTPFHVDDIDDFVDSMKLEELKYDKIFIPKINTFSYDNKFSLPYNGIHTPPMKKNMENHEDVPTSIYYSFSGTTSMTNQVLDAVKELGMNLYKPIGSDGPGTEAGPDMISNKNVLAYVCRAGWASIWMAQQAGKPCIVPEFKDNDDPEIYHNVKTIESLGLGVSFKNLNQEVLKRAVSKTSHIKRLNLEMYRNFGTFDGISFAAGCIRRDLGETV